MNIWALKLDFNRPISQKRYDSLFALCEEYKRKRIERYRFREDKLRCLFGDLLVRSFYSKTLGCTPSAIRFALDDSGKPYLSGHPNRYFNISHSGEWVLAAFADAPVGIDVEAVKEIDFDLAWHFFCESEIADLENVTPERRAGQFYVLWTMKESFIKCDGRGLSIPLDSFCINMRDGTHVLKFLGGEINTGTYHLRRFDLDPHYRIAVCSASGTLPPDFPKEIEIIPFENLIREFTAYNG